MRRLWAVLVVLAVTGCAGSPSSEPKEAPGGTAWSNAQAFTQAVWTYDLGAARAKAAPGSPAERYLDYTEALLSATSATSGSQDETPAAGGSLTLTIDDEAGTITDSTAGGAALVWRGFSYSGELVSGWVVGDSDLALAERLWSQDARVDGDSASAELAGAYRNDAGLWVVARVTAGDAPVELADEVTYLREGTEVAASHTSIPERIEPRASELVAFGFEGVELGGTLRLTLSEPSGELLLPVR